MKTNGVSEFDLRPDPRILPMLGEISLLQWRCIAELVDNSIDGFLHARRENSPVEQPEVHISLPSSDSDAAHVEVRDNGPGMSPEVLERAVTAGWSGNNPVDSLGMFGMGFNIATARLGTSTTVWTSRKGDSEWHGLRIDFDELRKQGHFRTPHLTRPKIQAAEHGTEIRVERLKVEQRVWLSKAANQSRVRKELGATYAAMLRPNGVPMSFALFLNGPRISGRQHCVWGEERAVEVNRYGTVNAVQRIDRKLEERPFCLSCWNWASTSDGKCIACGPSGRVMRRQRRVYGWLGIQRYLDDFEYGIDFIRNGRKIELGNKDLFIWKDESSEEPEYPVDDPRDRGRIVGEIHLDHCRVTYTKDRFDRNDPAWDDMVRIVRGDSPLRPDKARDLGFGINQAPLSLLFQTFRRSTPKPKIAGSWARLMVVHNNDQAIQMAKRFHAGEAEYQDDHKWWELVEEQDRELLKGEGEGKSATPEFGDPGTDPKEQPPETPKVSQPTPAYPRAPIPSLSREYIHDRTQFRAAVRAYAVDQRDAELRATAPWRLIRTNSGNWDFYVNPSHEVFRSATLTSIDALLCELAWAIMDMHRLSPPDGVAFSTVLTEMRLKYADASRLDPAALSAEARLTLSGLARHASQQIAIEGEGGVFFQELSPIDQDAVLHKMAARGNLSPQRAISEGRFLEFANSKVIGEFFVRHPDFFFDGKYWDVAYSTIDFGRAAATEAARDRLIGYYGGLISDAAWLADQDPADLDAASRVRLLRAALSLELLAPYRALEESIA
jgi:hypothetical protein